MMPVLTQILCVCHFPGLMDLIRICTHIIFRIGHIMKKQQITVLIILRGDRATGFTAMRPIKNIQQQETRSTLLMETVPSDNETQIWATDGQKVGNGTYLFYVEDVSEKDVQNFKLVLSGPGLSDNITYGPYDFKDDDDNSTTEAVNPQAVFFIQVENNSIVRSDNISVGKNLDNVSSTLMQWTGTCKIL